ncbi:MAG: sigma-54-dependent Fis family transcriptional regulator [Phycisphaerae bacterium]|nr:sigma-54-dependent Fis family transcriptional regulator [Phycisphaerae bacterium]
MTTSPTEPKPAARSDAAAGRARILIVDDDPIVTESLRDFLAAEGYEPSTANGVREAIDTLAAGEKPAGAGQVPRPFAVVISDVAMPADPVLKPSTGKPRAAADDDAAPGGMRLLRHVAAEHPGTVVLMLTGYGTIEQAVEAIRLGAADYLTKPVVDDELRMALERALRQQALLSENRALKAQLDERFGLDSIVGSDPRMLRTYDLIQAVAPTKTTVLMSGESGTGKSLIAHAIHLRSPRRDKPFVELACGSIPETLLESELFGHVKGAFTGAHADKAGKFLAAHGGTLFLDEINSASPGMQLKLLRVLQERRFEPVGSNQTIEADVRVILATNQPLEHLVAKGLFRQDLYYRINVVKIDLPPLRERLSDIPLLAEHFLRKHAADLGRTFTGFSPDAMDLLRRYAFPGNVRELSNIVERAAVLARRPTIEPEDLPPNVSGIADASAIGATAHASPGPPTDAPAGDSPSPRDFIPIRLEGGLEAALREPERRLILAALRACNWNRAKAAELLQINRTTLYKKMDNLGIDPAVEARAG